MSLPKSFACDIYFVARNRNKVWNHPGVKDQFFDLFLFMKYSSSIASRQKQIEVFFSVSNAPGRPPGAYTAGYVYKKGVVPMF